MVTISITASAQWGKHHGRYNNRYYPSYRYYPGTSVSVFARLPFGAVSVTFGDRYYHYYNGIHYRPCSRGYIIVAPPIGIIVPALPFGAAPVIIGSHSYYRSGNVYYAPYGNRYKVVDDPASEASASAGDTIGNNEYEKVVLEGKTYYKKGDKYYKASVNKNGEIIYEEVGEGSR